jgi:hypothetical protein
MARAAVRLGPRNRVGFDVIAVGDPAQVDEIANDAKYKSDAHPCWGQRLAFNIFHIDNSHYLPSEEADL